MSNQKHCRSCRHLDCNTMSDEMYCKLKDYEPIRLRWHKQRPDWCPLVTGGQKGEPMNDLIISTLSSRLNALDLKLDVVELDTHE